MFIYIIRCQGSTFQIFNLEPKFFVLFNGTINHWLDVNSLRFGFTSRNLHLDRFSLIAYREFVASIGCADIRNLPRFSSISSISTRNTYIRIEFKAIAKGHISFRSLTQANLNGFPSAAFYNVLRFFIQNRKFNVRIKLLKDKVFSTNFITNFNFISNQLSRKNNITYQLYGTGTHNGTHNGHIVNICESNIRIYI